MTPKESWLKQQAISLEGERGRGEKKSLPWLKQRKIKSQGSRILAFNFSPIQVKFMGVLTLGLSVEVCALYLIPTRAESRLFNTIMLFRCHVGIGA